MMPEVDIVIVSWNARKHLEACLLSLERTIGGVSARTIVVDNASSDDSVDMVRRHFPSVEIVQNAANYGYARACNIGIRAGSSPAVAIVNSDIIIQEGCIQRLLACLASRPRAGMVGPLLLSTTGKPSRSTMSFPTLTNSLFRAAALDTFFPRSRVVGSYLMAWAPGASLRAVDVVNGAFWMLRRTALDSVGLLDEGFFFYGEDIDLCRRLAGAGWERWQEPRAAAIHVGGASSARQPLRYYLEMQRANIRYWRKHRGGGAARAYAMVLALQMALRLLGYAVVCSLRRPPGVEERHKMRRSRQAIRWLLQNG